MASRLPSRAEVNPDKPRAWGTCDRCGFITNVYKLQWQHQWQGTKLQNLRLLVCEDCYDRPAPFLRSIVIPPDPAPLQNIRSENYAIDEAGPIQPLTAALHLNSIAITSLFLDLYNADPAHGGVSQLQAMTGSAFRQDFVSIMSPLAGISSHNTDTVSLVLASLASVSVSWLLAFDAPTGGLLLAKSSFPQQTVVTGNGLAMAPGRLTVTVQPQFFYADTTNVTADNSFYTADRGHATADRTAVTADTSLYTADMV